MRNPNPDARIKAEKLKIEILFLESKFDKIINLDKRKAQI